MTRIVVARDRLAPALARAARIAARQTTIPILTTVMLAARRDELRITATDTEASIEEAVATDPGSDWAGCVDAGRLAGFVNALSGGGTVTVTAGDDRVEIRCGRAIARLPVLPAEDFPVWGHTGSAAADMEIPAAELAAVIAQLAHALPDPATERARYYLDGICLHAPGTAVATDGHRLARCRLSVPIPPDLRPILPSGACLALQRLLRGTADTVQVRLSRTAASFACGSWIYRSKLIDGEYPDYERILPARLPEPVTVDRAALAEAIARVRSVALDQRTNAIVLAAAEDEIVVSGEEALGAGEDAAPTGGGAFDPVAIQHTFLTDALASLSGSDEVELHVASPTAPVWLCAAGEEHDGVVLMPMRITTG